MAQGKRGSGPDGFLDANQICERDLFWLMDDAGGVLLRQLETCENDVPQLLRGIAKTASKTALHLERRMGLAYTGKGSGRGRRKRAS